MTGARRVAVAAAILWLAACSEPLSDTGYAGTWVLRNDRLETRIAIVAGEGGGYRFRLSQSTADGKSILRCDWDGECRQTIEGAVAARFRFTPRVDPATGRLRVRCEGGPDGPEAATVVYENELVVDDGGLRMESFTVERAGQLFEGDRRPRRTLEKVSDRVEEPPEDVR